MKNIEIEDELYHYIASRTQSIGESASDILRRLLRLPSSPQPFALVQQNVIDELKEMAKPKEKKHLHHEPRVKSEVKRSSNEQLEKVLDSALFTEPAKGVVRFLTLLEALYKHNPDAFAKATEMVTGNSRTYFAKDEASLLKHGNSVKAKQIPSSPFWVVTNNNTNRKGLIVTNVMREMGLPKKLIKRVQGLFV